MPLCRYPSLSTEHSEECEGDFKCLSDYSVAESAASGFINVQSSTQIYGTRKPPNIEHEVNVAKSLMQQCSSATGDNLFDHLADLIKRVMKDRPDNIVDYFEEFSYNVREQKYRITENFSWFYYTPPDIDEAKAHFKLMKLATDTPYNVCKIERRRKGDASSTGSSEDLNKPDKFQRILQLNENVNRLHLYWALCGLNLTIGEVQKLAYAMQKIQNQPNVEHARFWGKIYGLKKPYYIVEVMLTQEETEIRLEKMREEMMEKMSIYRNSSEESVGTPVDYDLVPGVQWQDQPEDVLEKMRPFAKPVPKPKVDVVFDIPPEAIGTGLNRRAYFVVNALNEDWMELPIVTPKQIQIARQIKKFLTGDLEADIISYPHFPGTEKHYLRAMIARITSGTYVAPYGYYRRLTKKERMEFYGEDVQVVEVDEDEELGLEEDEELDNDALITEDSEYDPSLAVLMFPNSWVHVRPNILDQGRVVYFDEEAARKALEKESRLRLMGEGEIIEEEEEGEDEVGEEQLTEDEDKGTPWAGPALFTPCSVDTNEDGVESWTPRYSSVQNKICQGVMIRSNLWPGAYSFAFDKYADSIYLGWGFKFNSRNMNIPQIPPIQDDYYPDDKTEILDPTVAMEEALRLYLEKKLMALQEFTEEEAEEEEIC